MADDFKNQTYIRRPSEYHPMSEHPHLDKGYSPLPNTVAGEREISGEMRKQGFSKAADKLDKSGEAARRRDVDEEGP